MRIKGGRSGSVRLMLEEPEADLIRGLLTEMKLMLEQDVPGDPVRDRLFPHAYDDGGDEEAFRALTHDDLQTAKQEALLQVRDALGTAGTVDITLESEETAIWLRLLTDLRLAIGTRLDVTEETMAEEIDPDEPETAAMSVLHWLGWMQESMLERLR